MKIRRNLVVQTAFPGDSVLTLPFLQELKRLEPESEIDVVCSPSCLEIFEASPVVSKVLPFDKRSEYKGFRGIARFAAQVKENDYSKIYSLHRSFRTTLLVSLIRGEETIGFSTSSFSFLYDKRVKYDYRDHEVKRNLNFLGNYGDESWKIFPQIVATDEQRQKVNDFVTGLESGKKIVVISPGSVWETKKYPLKNYAEVAAELSAGGYQVLISGSSGEKSMGDEIVKITGGSVINCCGNFSMVESVELMRHAALVITNDSAPTHFAMAAGVPVLTIYCSTVPEFGFYGYSETSRYISAKVNCKPCGVHGHKKCPKGDFECGTTIHFYEVVSKVKEIMDERT